MGIISIAYTGHRPKGLPGGGNYYSDDNVKLKRLLRLITFEVYKSLVRGSDNTLQCIGGGANGVDTFALDNCLYLKERFPDEVRITLASPFRDFDYGRGGTWAHVQENIKNNCNEIVYVDELDEYALDGVEPAVYDTRKYIMRDRYMVDKCTVLVAVLNNRIGHLRSGSMTTYMYAKGVKDIILVDTHSKVVSYIPREGSNISNEMEAIINLIKEQGGIL